MQTIKEQGFEYGPLEGLEGPIRFKSGRVLYWDPWEGLYYDRTTDMYICRDDDSIFEVSPIEYFSSRLDN